MATSPLIIDSQSGGFQAQVFPDTGQIALAGTNLVGAGRAVIVTLEPIELQVANKTVHLGRVVGPPRMSAGVFEFDHDLDGAKATAQISFPIDGVMRYEIVNWNGPTPASARISVLSAAAENFFGFGERFNALKQTGRRLEIKTQDHPGAKFTPGDPAKPDFAYKAVPWFLSSLGYGFHLDSHVESTFDMRSSKPDRYMIEQSAIPRRSGGLALHLVGGPKLTDVLSRYTAVAGRPPLPPPWAFGPWISSDAWRNGGEVQYVVRKFRERKIPVSAFVFDSPWEKSYNDFLFNIGDGAAPDPQTQFGSSGTFEDQPADTSKTFDGFKSLNEMMQFFQTHGLKVVCWMTPFVNDESAHDEQAGEAGEVIKGQKNRASNFGDGVARGVFVPTETDGSGKPGIHWWKGHGRHIDFTNPTAQDWLKNQLVKLITSSRVSTKSGALEPCLCGFKTDDGEALTGQNQDGNPHGVYLSNDAKYFDPRVTAQEMRNRYSVEYHKAVFGILNDAVGANRGIIFSRGGSHGSQAFPGCWAGDNEPNFHPANGLPSVVVAGLSAALSGFSIWGHDTGGYQRKYEPAPTDIDLFMRWTQFGCFTPIMQMHRQLSDKSPNISHLHGQYPWGYVSAAERADATNHGREFTDNEALRNFRFYAELHTQLFPYIYTFAQESSKTGLPILRPLLLLHQDDPQTFDIHHVYYFGSELIVAPVVEPNVTARVVYLPKGQWIDFWTNERIDRSAGGGNHAWANPDRTRLPVFAREGAIIPMLADLPQTLCDADYVNNDQVRTPTNGLLIRIYPAPSSDFVVHDGTAIACTTAGGKVAITINSPIARPVHLMVLAPRPAGQVTVAGTNVPEQAAATNFAAAATGWRHDATLGFVEIKLSLPIGPTAVTF
ncbi:glycoside hydrolase family 31 protein [Planctomicrobium piriforme]|uniref:Alpha-D-xyloside xylohydrolase n=1 Tax=Planctomicrobium piriforme TaxID=1576369 RepID=A0A1I3GHU3_9PLAN|nr:TIM-barrel domain-containing protein [Planctomicrobium piriforme]SFI23049.1 alpha-D-xyloside xylohydrolase [Planctomicrobium piriforme]